MIKKACITGIGMIDALGNNPKDCFDHLNDNLDYKKECSFLYPECPIEYGYYPDQNIDLPSGVRRRTLPRAMKYGIYAAHQAIIDSQVEMKPNVGVFFSSLVSGNDIRADITDIDRARIKNLKLVSNTMLDSLASHLSMYYGFEGINTCFQSACATGLVTLDFALQYIDNYDYILVGGTDAGIQAIDMNFFNMLSALGNNTIPFNDDRNGFAMGEGSGALIIESEENALKRNANIYAYVYSAGHASDAFDKFKPNGIGASRAIEQALKCGKTPDWINAHATATPAGDDIEYDVIKSYFPDAPIVSNKGKIGHTFAAAGILELIYSVLSMKKGVIPHNQGYTGSLKNIVKETIYRETNIVLNNSFGFGGKCVSTIIENT